MNRKHPRPECAFEPFVSVEAVAAHLSIERRQVLEMTWAGKLPAHPIDPNAQRRRWRYKMSEVDAAICSFHESVRADDLAETVAAPHNGDGSPRSRRG